MPDQHSNDYQRATSQHEISVRLFGPLRLAQDLNRRTERVIKANTGDRDHFTDITLRESRPNEGIVVDYFVLAKSPALTQRVGIVYVTQLCDLLSVVTECPVKFFSKDEDAREERSRTHRQPMQSSRTLTSEEWSWVTGSLVALRRDHPRFLAAASWFRKGLIGGDCLDCFCCFFRVIDRIASSYADKSNWEKGDGGLLKAITQLTDDLFDDSNTPELLSDIDRIKTVKELRNDISHGNKPITIDMIDYANEQLPALQDAAFCILDCFRQRCLEFTA
jgi:hypothetical protein